MRIRWREFELPNRVVRDESASNERYGMFVAEPFERGFAATVGNGLRRVLLSSLEGAAVTHVKIAGVQHEFSAIEGVVEDMTEFVLNIKRLLVKVSVTEPRRLTLKKRGKGPVTAATVHAAASSARALVPEAEIVLIVTLSTQRFARDLLGGLLRDLVELEAIDRLALNAVKPPPHWCDRRFWLSALAQLGPLLRDHLDRRLFLDCYVAARILGLGGCPARPDLSPAGAGSKAAIAFRGCVYQPAPDFVTSSAAELTLRLSGFVAPAVCPFPIE